MKSIVSKPYAMLGILLAATAMMVGCGQQATDSGSAQVASASPDSGADDHSGWWCPEHGVPEKDCSMCSSTAAAKFKEKGDWCEEHNRAESQCFKCDPSRADKFAKLYEAKFGSKPPEATE